MSYIVVKGKGKRKLNGFESGDLPICNKTYFNERTGRLEYKFSNKQFSYHKDCYTVFSTVEEAESYIQFIRDEITNNTKRYESVLKGSTGQLLKYTDDLHVIEDIK